MRIGYQGGEGAYSYIAARKYFSQAGAVQLVGIETFSKMLDALETREIDRAVLPIENSIAGSINESYDLLAHRNFSLVGEVVQPIAHCLIGVSNMPLGTLERILSHPVALAQCGKFLATLPNCHAEAFPDTALAVAKVKADKDPRQAAIASAEAAELYGLPVIRRDISDELQNYTRMVIVSREPVQVPLNQPAKTSIIFSTAHEQGALARCIMAFSKEGLNLSKLESRPVPSQPFEYRFYLDVEGNLAEAHMQRAMQELEHACQDVRVLGCYALGNAH